MEQSVFLFKVKEVFQINGKGLVLNPGSGSYSIETGNEIKLVRPDKTSIVSFARAIEVRDNLLKFNEDEDHADTNVCAIWRHTKIGKT